MALDLGHNIHERQRILILKDFERGRLATQNLGKNVVFIVSHVHPQLSPAQR
jgi:hypothetical protein